MSLIEEDEEREEERKAIESSRVVLRNHLDGVWGLVPELKTLTGMASRGVLSKAQRIAAMEDGVRKTEEDSQTFIVHSDS